MASVRAKAAVLAALYHERQDEGSNMCAQHALNALLQSPLFSAAELATIARQLDDSEAEARGGDRGRAASRNMDDSGFFSIQVLDEALKVFGVRLARWKSEEMRPLHENPERQAAFIFNLDSHWFTIRRFGGNPDYFYDLNSFKKPEHVGKLYLGLQIDQAQTEGYSIFVVLPRDDTASVESFLPPCEADEVVFEQAKQDKDGPIDLTEDDELQKAIQASLQDVHTPTSSASSSRPSKRESTSHSGPSTSNQLVNIPDDDEDPELAFAIAESLKGSQASAPPTPFASAASPAPRNITTPTPAATGMNRNLGPQASAASVKSDVSHVSASEASQSGEAEEEQPSAEEIRRRRLARFG